MLCEDSGYQSKPSSPGTIYFFVPELEGIEISRRRRGIQEPLDWSRRTSPVRWGRDHLQDGVPCIPQENEARLSGDEPWACPPRLWQLQSGIDPAGCARQWISWNLGPCSAFANSYTLRLVIGESIVQ